MAALALLLAAAGVARADLTGPYEGHLASPRLPQAAAASGVLTQSGRRLSGTLVISAADAVVNGVYSVTGTAGRRHLRVVGTSPRGVRLVWRGVLTAGGAVGALRLRGPGVRLKGRLRLGRQVAAGDGSSCDSVFAQNETFFTGQVMGQVLVATCAACHVPGGQAASTRLRVVRDDPLATARSVALVIDVADPSASLLLQKPIAAVPHGGGQQLQPGGTQAQILRQWVDMVAASRCVAGAGGAAADPFAQYCAGCHGASGAGSATAPEIQCAVRTTLADAIRRGRGPAMPVFSLSAGDVTAIGSYLAARCSGQAKDVYTANCGGCHGPTAGGGIRGDGAAGPDIRCSEAGDFTEALRSGTEGMPAFPDLGGAQIVALERWVSGFCTGGGGD